CADNIAGNLKGLRRGGLVNVAGNTVVQPVEFSAGLLHHCGGKRGVQFGVGGIGNKAQNRHDDRYFRENMVNTQRRAVLIAGPTASGKSALALTRARAGHGLIVNADAMQVYDTLRVVTARPSAEDELLAEHRLYGSVPAGHRFSTGQWLAAVGQILS